jgi:hypothetical protein
MVRACDPPESYRMWVVATGEITVSPAADAT